MCVRMVSKCVCVRKSGVCVCVCKGGVCVVIEDLSREGTCPKSEIGLMDGCQGLEARITKELGVSLVC